MKKKLALSTLAILVILMTLTTVVFATEGSNASVPWYAPILESGILPIAIIILVFYFVLFRPENKRKKETANMRENLKSGDEITTIGGIVGKIISVKEDQVIIETSNEKNKLRLMKWAISSVNKKKEDPVEEKSGTEQE